VPDSAANQAQAAEDRVPFPLSTNAVVQSPEPMNEDRIIEIEIKLTRQEDLVESLNQVVYQQQKKIDKLEALCAELVQHLKNQTDSGSERSLDNERPPHY
jgi:SlyX protein